MQTHYIFVTGGVISGLEKEMVTASIGKILQFRDFKLSVMKIDGYLNFDTGILRFTEHSKVLVTENGGEGEIDQDLGHYERFLEFVELENHPYFVATQARPEFKWRALKPAPLFNELIEAIFKKVVIG